MKQLLSFAFLILLLSVTAQVKYEFGPEGIPAKDLRLNEVLGGNENYFYTHKISTEGKGVSHFIQKIERKTLLPVDLKQFVYEEDGFKIELSRLIYSNNRLLAFLVKNAEKSNMVSCVVVAFDINSLAKINETVLSSFEMKSYYTPNVVVKVSPDNAKTVVKISAASINPTEIFAEFSEYDNARGIRLWNKKFIENERGHESIIRDERISNGVAKINASSSIDEAGNAHYAYTLESANSTKKEELVDLHYTFIDAKTHASKDILLPAEVKCTLQGYKITPLANNQVSVSGLFREINSEKKYSELERGVYNFVVDNTTSQIISKKFSFFKQFNPDGDLNNNPKKLEMDYTLDKIIAYDNSCVLIGHKERGLSVSSQSGVAQYSLLFYFDIFIIKLNKNSEVEYYRQLPVRSRINSGDGPNHIVKQFIESIKDDNLYVIHNEHPESTAIIESNDKTTELAEVSDGAKHLVCNKFNLKTGANQRAVIEIPPKNKFMPVLEAKYNLARPYGAEIFDRYADELFIPIGWGGRMERFLKIRLE